MKFDEYRHFVTIVAGDNPEKLMEDYNKMKKVPEYIVYKKEDAEKIKQHYISVLNSIKESSDIDEIEKEDTINEIEYAQNLTAKDFFDYYTDEYEHDDNGNAVSNVNPNGKWSAYEMGNFFSVPFITKNGRESFTDIKCNINWDYMNNYNREIFETTWDLVMEGKEPTNEQEKTIYENMKNRTVYFNKFGTKKNYVTSCTAFWGYAFLSKETGWVELDDDVDQYEWMSSYYSRFIKPLGDDTVLTIFECNS